MSVAVQQLLNALGALVKWWVTVAPWEAGVRVRLGRIEKLLGPGVHLRLPLIDRAFVQTTRRRYSAVPTQTLTMSDGKTVTVAGSLGYAVLDVQRLYHTLHHAEATLEAEAQNLVTDYLLERPWQDGIGAALRDHVQQHLDFDRYGIGETEFVLTTLVCTKTLRIVQGEPRDYTRGEVLNTQFAEGETDAS